MKHRITTIFLWLLLTSTAFGQIRVFNWNNGENETATDPIGSRGFSPRWQYQRLLDDDPLLPTFEFYDPLERNGNPDDFYYRDLWSFAKSRRHPQTGRFKRLLPVNFVMRNLADIPRINDFPVTEETGFLLTADGSLVKKMSPFGPVDGWRYLGQRIAAELKPFHDDYPHAPWVMLSDNNEAGEAEIGESLRDPRCPQRIKDLDSQSQRDVIARLYRTRYRACFAEIRKALPFWGDRIRFAAYSGSLGEHGISRYRAEPDRYRAEPDRYSHPWNSPTGLPNDMITRDVLLTNVGYLYISTKYNTVNCPQIRAENQRYALHHYQQETGVTRIPAVGFSHLRAPEDIEIWRGMVRSVLWITKPEIVFEYDSSNDPASGKDLAYYNIVIEEVRRLHKHRVLQDHWNNGSLVENHWRDERSGTVSKYDQPNAGYGHPFRQMLPRDYRDLVTERWHLLHVPLNKWTGHWSEFRESGDNRIIDRWARHGAGNEPVYVHAVCSVKGGERLLFAHSTGETYSDVKVLVPDVGMVTVPVVPPEGKTRTQTS